VATRPASANGLDMSVNEAILEIQQLTKAYLVLPENELILSNWKTLVTKYAVKGKKSHDARLVAFMQSHQIQKLYTLNMEDFKRFEAIIEFI
jgi:predicted nucleic acid-binding protein